MFYKVLLHERNLIQFVLDQHMEKLNARDNPPGILLCQRHKAGFRWQHKYLQDGRTVTVGLRKTESMLAEKLAVNLYRMICIEFLLKQIACIDNYIKNQCSEVSVDIQAETSKRDFLVTISIHTLLRKVRNCPRESKDFFQPASPYKSFIVSHLEKEYAEVIDWYLGDFKQSNEYLEHRQFPVKLGYNVRSKSEVMEADRLFEEGILFHYEELIRLSDEEAYPDFLIQISLSEKYAFEHFGAMDKDGYFYRTKGKIMNYLDHQWFLGINMITTYETRKHPLTEEEVDHRIRWLK